MSTGSPRLSARAGSRRRPVRRAAERAPRRACRGARVRSAREAVSFGRPAELEQSLRHPADLNLLRALGNSVPAVMPVDVFERLVAGVSDTAEHLHRTVGGVTHKAIGAVVGHRHLVGYLEAVVAVEMPGGIPDQQAHHLRLGLQLDQRPLNRLVDGQRLAEYDAITGIGGGAVDAVLPGAAGAGG